MFKFLDIIKANAEIGKLQESIKAVSDDKAKLEQTLAEYETQFKAHVETVQSIDQLTEAHKAELEKVKSEYELKLAEKDKELTATKEQASKDISATKETIAAETIALVASQVTSAPIETIVKTDNQMVTKTKSGKTFKVISHINK